MAARGLGKGLDALIPSTLGNDVSKKSSTSTKAKQEKKEEKREGETIVNITKVEPNREQPRKNFDEDALEELAESIKQFGLLQPILVQDRKTYYEIIAGERRWRAAKKAGLKEVPVIIKNLTEQEIVEISLIENIQREDLNPIEIALSLQRLLNECNITQENLAEKVAKSRSVVTNYLRLLKLGTYAQKALISNQITFGHARALVAIEDVDTQESLVNKIINQKLSVRQTEDMLRKIQQNKTVKTIRVTLPKHLQVVKQSLTENLKTKVDIKYNLKGKGNLIIQFKSEDELNRILSLIKK